jgi:hypothetical protein
MSDNLSSTPFAGTLAAGISPSLQPDWSNRRRVIFMALYFCGTMAGLIIVTTCALAILGVFYHSASDNMAILSFFGSSLYTLAFVSTTIIGSYVFGVNFDWANTRQHIAGLVSTTTGSTTVSTTPAGNVRMQTSPREPVG